jgi:hypothetical protein
LSLIDEPDDNNDDYRSEVKKPTGFNKNNSDDLFNRCLTYTLDRQQNKGYIPVQVNANTLLAMKRSEVYVCKPSSNQRRATFYKYYNYNYDYQ